MTTQTNFDIGRYPQVREAVATLCSRFEEGDYNPTPIIDLGALVANADGYVDPSEIETLRQVLEQVLGTQLDKELVGYLVNASLEVIRAAGVESRARLIAEVLLDCDAVEEGVMLALAIAFASEGLSDPERNIIEAIARAARLTPVRFNELVEKMRTLMA